MNPDILSNWEGKTPSPEMGQDSYTNLPMVILLHFSLRQSMLKFRDPSGIVQGVKEDRDKKWSKLENAPWPNRKGKRAWDLTKAQEMEDVRREARKN